MVGPVKNEDFIYVSQILDMFNELQRLLKCPNLLNKAEIQLIESMAIEKPLLKLYHNEVVRFILRLVQYGDFMRFLRDRCGISSADIERLLDENRSLPRKPLSSYSLNTNIDNWRNTKSMSTSTPMTFTERLRKQTSSPSNSTPFKRRELYNLAPNSEELNRPLSSQHNWINLADKYSPSIDPLLRKTQELQDEVISLKTYIDTLESQLNRVSTSNAVLAESKTLLRDFASKNADLEKKIRLLEDMCEKYQKRITLIEAEDIPYENLIHKLALETRKQEQLIQGLKSKLKLDEHASRRARFKKFLRNLPFIKQYYIYYKYQKDLKSFGMVLLNVVTLFLSCIIIINFLKFVFFFSMGISSSLLASDAFEPHYIYDKYQENDYWPSSALKFEWWKEIDWLEYLVYSIGDWIDR